MKMNCQFMKDLPHSKKSTEVVITFFLVTTKVELMLFRKDIEDKLQSSIIT